MIIDHDAIAARVRQDMKAGTPGPWKCGKNNPARVSRKGRYIADFDPLHSNAPKCEIDARRAAHLPDLETAYLAIYGEGKRLRFDLRMIVDDRDRTFVLLAERAEKAEAERDALRAHPYLPAEEIAAIERGNRRWHGEYDTTVSVRWEPYKPDGQRQMKAKGRWQTMTFNSSDYFRWENCNRPAQVRQALKGGDR